MALNFYDKYMNKLKMRKRMVLILAMILIVALLSVSLAGCLKIAMREDNIKSRISDSGGTFEYLRTLPFDPGGTAGTRLGTIMRAYVPKDGESRCVIIVFARDTASGDRIEEVCKSAIDNKTKYEGQNVSEWNIYRYDNMVMFGDYRAIAIARGY